MSETFSVGRPAKDEYFDYFGLYIDRVGDVDILNELAAQIDQLREILDAVPQDQADVIHAPYSWTIKQVVGHIIDTERVFAYRAARFAAADAAPLPGFDQDHFVANTDYSHVGLPALVDELIHLRHSNLGMFHRMSRDVWDRDGMADGKRVTVRAIAYILAGHLIHHLEIIQKRLSS